VHDVRVDGAMDWGRLGLVVLGFVVGVAIAAMMDPSFAPPRGRPHQHLGHERSRRHDRPEDSSQVRRARLAVVGALTLHASPRGWPSAPVRRPRSSHLGLLLAIAVASRTSARAGDGGPAAPGGVSRAAS